MKITDAELVDWLQSCNVRECAGTLHRMGNRIAPCMGDGFVLLAYSCERTNTRLTAEVVALAATLTGKSAQVGDEYTATQIQPTLVAQCPCVGIDRRGAIRDKVREQLGVVDVCEPRPNQIEAIKTFEAGKNLFIHGAVNGGKTVLAYLCAAKYYGNVQVFIGTELTDLMRRMNLDNREFRPYGLVIWDDADVVNPTEFVRERLWAIFDRVNKGKLRMIITSNLTPSEYVNKYVFDMAQRSKFENRLGKFETVLIRD